MLEWVIDDIKPPFFDYLLGPSILVSPVVANSTTNTTETKVHFLAGASWAYWFNTSVIVRGRNASVPWTCPLSEFPAFQRVGDIVPLNRTRGAVLALSVVAPQPGTHVAHIREFRGAGMTVQYTLGRDGTLEFCCSAHDSIQVIIELDQLAAAPTDVSLIDSEGRLQPIAV